MGRKKKVETEPNDKLQVHADLDTQTYERLIKQTERFKLSIAAYVRMAVILMIEDDEARRNRPKG